MASKTIRGLTVEIGGDTKKLGDAVRSAEKQLKNLNTELRDVNRQLKFDDTDTRMLTQKTELLSKAIEACADKLRELHVYEQKMAAMESRTEKEEEQYRALQREISETETKMGDYQRQLDRTNRELVALGVETDEVRAAIDRMNEAAEESKTPLDRIADGMQELNTKSDSLSKELKDIDKILKESPRNITILWQKYKVLSEAWNTCSEKLKLLEEAEREVQERFERGEATEAQVREIQREIVETTNKLDRYKDAWHGVCAELDDALVETNNASRVIDGTGDAAEKAARDVNDMGDKSKQAAKKVDDLADKTDRAGDIARRAGDGFTVFKGVVADLLADGLRELVECLKEVGKYTLQTGMDFEQTMSKVEALLDPTERTTENMEALTAMAMEMGATTKFSATESAEALTYLAQAGWTTEQMLVGLPGVMNLAATDGIDLATAAEITAQAINSLGYEAEDASKFADILAVTSAATCTNVEDMGYAFQYVGPVAGALGFSMEDLAVAIGMMADAGITGEKAGTSLRSLFTNMAKPTKAMTEAMEKYGISLTDSEGDMLPLMDVMQNLRTVFAGLTEEQQAELAATLAGKTGMAGLLAIVNASPDDFEKMTGAIAESNGEAEKMSTIMQDNLAGDIEKLGGAFDTLAVKITENFNESLRQAVQAMTAFLDGEITMQQMLVQLVDAFAQMYQSFQTYLPTLQQIGSDLLIFIVNGITAGLPVLMTAATDLVANFCTFIAQNASTIVNVAGSLLTSFVQGLFNFIPTLIEGAARIVRSLASGITQNAQSFVSKALDLLNGFADKLTVSLPKLIQSGMQFILNLVKGLVASIPEFVAKAPEIISKFANLINDNMPTIFKMGAQIIWELIKGIVSLIAELLKNWKSVIKAVVDVWEAINWLSMGKKVVELLGKGVKAMWGFIKGIFTDTVNKVLAIVKKLPDLLKRIGAEGVQFFGNAIKSGWAWIKSAVTTIKDGIVNYFKGLPSQLLLVGKNLVEGLWNGIKSMASWIVDKVMGWGSAVLGALKEIFQEHSPSRATMLSGKNLVLGLAEGIDDTADEAIHAAESLAAGVLDGASMDGLALERDLQNRTVRRALSVTTMADATMLGKLDKILTAIEKGQLISIDGKQLVGATASMYDSALGQRRMLAARGAV